MAAVHPDRIWRNGTIITMAADDRAGDDRAHRTDATALASLGGRIVAIGTDAEVGGLAGPQTEVVDLDGATVLPGFYDSHTHILKGAKSYVYEQSLSDPLCRDIPDLQNRLRQWVQHTPPDGWVIATGLRTELFVDRVLPTRRDLDAVVADRPVLLIGPGSHVVIANSRALEIAGITAATPDPEGGAIDRFPDGEPTGVLRERGKLRLSERHPETVYPQYVGEQAVVALEKAAADLLLPMGITTIGAILVEGEELRACAQAVQSGRMPVRMSVFLRIVEGTLSLDDIDHVGLAQGFGSSRLRVGGVKISIDGAGLQRQAAFYEPYPGEPDNYGILRVEAPELEDLVARAHARGYRVLVHAIGERAADMALTAYEEALAAHPATDHRHRIEHLGNLGITDEQLARTRASELIASPQPVFLWEFGDEYVEIFGPERLRRAGAFRLLREARVPMMGSSDFGMTLPNPLIGVQFAVTRRTKGGQVLAPDQAIDVHSALRMYTADAAFADFSEDHRGTLEPGKAADLTILAENPLRVSPERIGSIPVLSTVVAGEVAFAAG